MGLESLYLKEMEREELEHRLSQRVAQLLSFYGHEIPRKLLLFSVGSMFLLGVGFEFPFFFVCVDLFEYA